MDAAQHTHRAIYFTMMPHRTSPIWIWITAPLALVYGIVIRLRNIYFDIRHKKGLDKAAIKTLVVGNLSVGGTGKTPFVDHLLHQHNADTTAVLSRGYGRKTKGYIEVYPDDVPERVGDEPLLLKRLHQAVLVVVCEDRQLGINTIKKRHPQIELVILDDAFQHRHVNPDKSILLTTWQQPFFKDHLLPRGNLREHRRGANRATEIVATKCPKNISEEDKALFSKHIRRYSSAPVRFSTTTYGPWRCVHGKPDRTESITLVTGIANPQPLLDHLESKSVRVTHLAFPDHHLFEQKDIDSIRKQQSDAILTTEKDWVRMARFDWGDACIYTQPIKFLML